MSKKRKFAVEQEETNEFSLSKKFLATSHVRAQEKRLIVVLEGAQLETVKVGYFAHQMCYVRGTNVGSCFLLSLHQMIEGWECI